MKYQIGFVQNVSQAPFFHLEAETPFPTLNKGEFVQAGTSTWEITSVLHRFLIDTTGTQWAITLVMVTAPSSQPFAGGDLVPWPW